MSRSAVFSVALLASLSCPPTAAPAHEFSEQEITIDCEIAEIRGTLTLPQHGPDGEGHSDRQACVVIVGGTLSQTRDGGFLREGSPPRDALKRLAHRLALSGYASIRYDKVGFGSNAKAGWSGLYADESQLAAAAIRYAHGLDRIKQVVIAGESAGAYLACLAAQQGARADAYVFLGGHCGSGPDIYEYNFARLVRLAESDAQWKMFAERELPFELALGKSYPAMFEAAARGESSCEVAYGDFRKTVGFLERRKEELDLPPDEMFRFIQTPALALSGEYDLNVPPDHAARIVGRLRKAGNHACTCVLIPGCDHSFQIGPPDEQARLRERYNFESFRREYSPELYRRIAAWLDDALGYAPSSALPAFVERGQTPRRAAGEIEREPVTESTPERLHLAAGVQIIEDVADKQKTAGVQTLEGEIGPLLLGEDCQAHFIDMPAGMYCEEHPHSNESIIYTVRGKWVLCSNGRRQVMKPGALFHFAPNTPTGYEVPFAEDAFILIFKGQRLTQKEEDFINYLKGMAQRLGQEHAAGVPYLLSDLPPDHPAIQFAKEANPEFGK